MAFLPSLSYLSKYGGELHNKGGVMLKARLSEWERELQYLRFRIAEWKQFGSVDHADYYPFRTFLLQKVRNHLLFELKTSSTILMACEVAAQSDDVPPVQTYVDSIFAFRERISPGEITRRIHLEEWQVYMRIRDHETDATQTQMDDMFAKMRNEIDAMERRSKVFKLIVDELIRMVADMQGIWGRNLRPGAGVGANASAAEGAGAGAGPPRQIQPDEFINVNGFWVRRATRIPPYAAHRREAASAGTMTRSPSDILPMPILANTRTRLPPPTGIPPRPPVPPVSPLPAASSPNTPRRLPTSISSISRRSRPYPPRAPSAPASPSLAMLTRRTICDFHPSSPSYSPTRSRSRSSSRSPPPPPPPPRTGARNIHRRLFRRMFHMSHNAANTTPRHRIRSRSPSPAARAPLPIDTPPPTQPPPEQQASGSGFSSYESPSTGLIALTRTRLPPPTDLSPISYRPPGQRLFSFLHRL